jgi:DNA repair photolyase
MTIREIKAKSILRKYKNYVDGEFGEDVTVKVNAIEILRRELNPKRKRTPFKRSYMMPGGGVGDSYQPLEKK